MPQFAGAKKAKQRQKIDDKKRMAEYHMSNANFVGAIECYAELVRKLCDFKSKQPNELGNTYKEYATANLSRAKQLDISEHTNANLHREQSILQIQQAILSYPVTAREELAACQAILTDLTAFSKQATHEDLDVDVEELNADAGIEADIDIEAMSSVEEIVKQKPEVLHWKKALLQRYLAEQAAENNLLQVEKSESNQCVPKIKY